MKQRSVTNRSLLLAELDRTEEPAMRMELLAMLLKLKTPNPNGNQTKLRKPGVTKPHSLTAAQIARVKRHEKPMQMTIEDVEKANKARFLSPSEQSQAELEPIEEKTNEGK